MIKVAFIAPTALIADYGSQGDINLVLSHLLTKHGYKNNYQKAIQKTKLPIYLDNGLFENGESEDPVTLYKKARRLGASYVFVPDTLYDRKQTEQTVDQTISETNVGVPIAAIVQADNPEDYVESYAYFAAKPEISMIGLSILSIPHSFKSITGTADITTNRIKCLEWLNKLEVHKPSHLLGAGSSYQDVAYAAENCPWVVSHDSSSAIWNGVQRKRIHPVTLDVEGGKTSVPVDFSWDEPLDDYQQAIIAENIAIVKEICHAV